MAAPELEWYAFDHADRVIGTVPGKTLKEAQLNAWSRWGSSVDRVQSKPSARISEGEIKARVFRHRRNEAEGGGS